MIIYLVRHGNTEDTGSDIVLSHNGHIEANLTAVKLHKLSENKPRKVFSSKMTRAVQTATHFTKNIYKHKFLGEYMRSSESFETFMNRVMRCANTLMECSDEESTYIIYSHAVFISALLSIIAKSRPKRSRDLVFRLDHASISKISLENYSWKILEVNNTGHLKPHSISRVIGGNDSSENVPEVSNIVGISNYGVNDTIEISDSFDF